MQTELLDVAIKLEDYLTEFNPEKKIYNRVVSIIDTLYELHDEINE
jgi:hypothetical protein